MDSASAFLAREHAYCDALLADVEVAVAAADWARADAFFPAFRTAMLRHFETEERKLFAAFEAATGSRAGPTQALRAEHDRMRALLDALRDALCQRDREAMLGPCEALARLMVDHHLREETLLAAGPGPELRGGLGTHPGSPIVD